MNFGDVAAGLMLEVGKRRVANLGEHIDPLAADQLRSKSYVDDSILGGSREEVAWMRGGRTDQGFSGTVGQILAKGAMTIKFMAVTGSDDNFKQEQLGGKCLGVSYQIKEDELHFKILHCYFLKKAKSADTSREVLVLGSKEVARLQAGVLFFSGRQALSMVMGLYDPLGLMGPVLVTGKLLLRRLYSPDAVTSWDQDLPKPEKQRWASWFTTLLDSKEATFPRTTRPDDIAEPPRLVGFFDCSDVAVCAAMYVVWKSNTAGVLTRLQMAKCRVAPLLSMTIPRGEMQSLVILTRLLVGVAEAFPARFASISSYTDSMSSLGALAKTSTALKPYFGNRVSEIQHLREQLREVTDDLTPVHHIPGDTNPADIGTRGRVRVDELGRGSTWQEGPSFLSLPYEDWPATREEVRKSAHIPQEEIRKNADTQQDQDSTTLVMTRRGDATAKQQARGQEIVAALYAAIMDDSKLGKSILAIAREVIDKREARTIGEGVCQSSACDPLW